jgi:hypothetical protein
MLEWFVWEYLENLSVSSQNKDLKGQSSLICERMEQ